MKHVVFSMALTALSTLAPIGLHAQTADTTITLPEVSLCEKRIYYFNAGTSPQRIDSSLITHNPAASLGDLLQFNSTLHVDAYGVGSSSVSARGMGPKRTPVIWNGFNLQSINGHDVDASTLQGFMADKIYVETGSQSALFGSGASGGIVYIENNANKNAQSQLSVGTGSYGKHMAATSVGWHQKSYSGDVRVYYDEAINDFRYKAQYINTKTQDTLRYDTKQLNAAKQQVGVMLNNYVQLSPSQQLKINLWYNNTDRQIAPTVKDVAQSKTTDATQLDENYRASVNWGYKKENVELAARVGYFASETDYAKPISKEKSNTQGRTTIGEVEATWQVLSYLSLNMGVHHTYEEAESSSYADKKSRQRSAAFGSARVTVPTVKTRVTLNGRIEKTEENTPSTYTLGLEQPLIGRFYAIAKMGTSYRVPSFNDLYWKSSYAVGNPNLKPEKGTNLEGGLAYRAAYKHVKLEAGASTFGMEMKNWMSWGKDADGVYTVLNQDSASIKGIEGNLAVAIGTSTKQIALRGNYTYLDARDPKTDKKLVYVPMNKSSVSLSGKWESISAILTRMQTDKVAINNANTDYLKGYTVYNLHILKELEVGKSATSVGIALNNLTNCHYQTRQYYPMMGRNILITANFKL